MSPLVQGWIIAVSVVFGYGFVGGAVGKVMLNRARSMCPSWPATKKWREGKGTKPEWSHQVCDAEDHMECFFIASFWPLALPFYVGMWATDHFSDEGKAKRENKAEKEHARKMELLKAETERNESARKLVEDYQP